MELTVPALDDGVVRLRPPEPDDVDAVFAYCNDPDAARFTTIPWPYEHRRAVEWIEESTRCWADGVRASFVIVEAATGEVVGSIGLVHIDHDADVAEVGYLVNQEARGRGIATRAVRLVGDWVLGELGFTRLELQTDVRNHASQRVAEKAGFTREGEVEPPERCRERSERMVMFSLAPADLASD
ncbi:MAG: GNAT family N-acetyltransferase [Actinomycetota bacterium]